MNKPRLIALSSVAAGAVVLATLGVVLLSRRQVARDPCPSLIQAVRGATASPQMTPIGGAANDNEGGAIVRGPPAIGTGALLFDLLSHGDPSLPSTVAIANGVPVTSRDYEGRLAMLEAFIQLAGPSASSQQSLGPKNIALTAAVVNTLVEQYGVQHGISVSETDVVNALTQQAAALQDGLNSGDGLANLVRQDLAVSGLTDPQQIVGNAGWQNQMCHILLRGKTVDALALRELPANERGPLNLPAARTKLETRLLKSAHVQVKIPAHLLDAASWQSLSTPQTFRPPPPPILPSGPVPPIGSGPIQVPLTPGAAAR